MERALPRDIGTGYRPIGAYVGGNRKAAVLQFGAWTNNPRQSYRELKRAIDAVAARWGGKDPVAWPAGWPGQFADQLERTYRASQFGMWGDDKARAAGRKSRTQKVLDALARLEPSPVREDEGWSSEWTEALDASTEALTDEVEGEADEESSVSETIVGGSSWTESPETEAEAGLGWHEGPESEAWFEAEPSSEAGSAAEPETDEAVDTTGEDSLFDPEDELETGGSPFLSWVPDVTGAMGPGESEGARGSEARVRWVQDSLNRVAAANLTVDGKMGPRTREAIQRFQQRAGLTADGIVGPQTERALVETGAAAPPLASATTVAAASPPRPASSSAGRAPSNCRGTRPSASTSLVVAGREFPPPTGLVVANWADRSVRPFTNPARPQCRRPASVVSFVLHETQGSIPWKPFRRDFLNDTRHLSVQMYADVDGRIIEHNDLVEVLWHGAPFNYVSIGIEIVAPVLPANQATVQRQAANLSFPLSRQLGLEPYRTIPTGWMQRRRDNPSRAYVLPPIDQMEGVAKLIGWLTDPSAGHGLNIPRRWVGDRGDGSFVLRGGSAFARAQPGVIGHAQFKETKDDGLFAALYCWLRLVARNGQGLAPADAYAASMTLLSGASGTVNVTPYR